jgi:ubiquinone/menaquinone biosynthesis C-methylase UbiE
MEIHDAIELLRGAVGASRGVWADLGAGTGTFTRALAALLGPDSTIYAVDDDVSAVRALRTLPSTQAVRLVPVKADFTSSLVLPGMDDALLDGILLANALHFVRDAQGVLRELVERLRGGGRVVVVEYDRREASRWVPYPIPASRWPEVAAEAGLGGAMITATRPSAYQGVLYIGTATKT